MQEKGGETVNKGPGSKKEPAEEFDIAGNVKERGQDPSPDDRERGETSSQRSEPGRR